MQNEIHPSHRQAVYALVLNMGLATKIVEAAQVHHCVAKACDKADHLVQQMETLEPDWVGLGSDAFFEEMQGEVLPAVQRLQEALEQAGMVTGEIVSIFQQADEEASSPFRT